MRPLALPLLLAALLSFGLAGRTAAQEQTLESFVQQVARLWAAGDAAGIVSLASAEGSLVLDTGSGTETVSARHAGAALRALFGDRETLSARPLHVTLAGGAPERGFGQIAWGFRSRAAPAAQTRSVYVGAVREGGAWRVTELRLMPASDSRS